MKKNEKVLRSVAQNRKEKVIYMPWVAAKLRQQGFSIIRVEVNPNKPQFDCYVFEETEELIAAFTAITNK